ncbi:hypothetical protein BATDEDRAFT_91312 [Batrachochytrium dendrobatidis JAM81]|uniref:Uncharacterized protein n=1 Tax=Batrachochytrium dendrobatidis (strain JAM81 / FGSC 10211) TaxID=684364 RepID=F4P9Z1_BATDJ|nr:uncharacterized protein BATDEDRAFT_91312 [Batrachochytrium dendrobatidis JAM81]EGF77912.1 hypothetical protein BATDEDRAFT_91312 [Batrachochytrium dendrobatidis JAM81]|eukprot:XP_006681503.1 hypothetical protein BATDEDRAFT_91312 [Batrachochytrium dendrobatidis JAM81]
MLQIVSSVGANFTTFSRLTHTSEFIVISAELSTPTRYHLNNDIISPEGYYAIQRLDMGVTMTATRENGYVSPTAIATPKNSPTPSVTYLTEDCIWPSDYPPVSKSTLSTTQTTRVASSDCKLSYSFL